jgi:hypothetical protein
LPLSNLDVFKPLFHLFRLAGGRWLQRAEGTSLIFRIVLSIPTAPAKRRWPRCRPESTQISCLSGFRSSRCARFSAMFQNCASAVPNWLRSSSHSLRRPMLRFYSPRRHSKLLYQHCQPKVRLRIRAPNQICSQSDDHHGKLHVFVLFCGQSPPEGMHLPASSFDFGSRSYRCANTN